MSKTNGAGKRSTSTLKGDSSPDPSPAPSSADKQHDSNKKRVVGRPFQKGQSGNPSGRAKGSVNLWSRIQRELLALDGKEKQELADRAAKAYVGKMLDGDSRILQDYMDREDGKAIQRMEHSGKDGVPLRMMVWPWEVTERDNGEVHPTDAASVAGDRGPVNGTVPSDRLRATVGENGAQ